MSIQTFGTVLIAVGSILGIVLGILIAIGVIPLFDVDIKKKVSGRPGRNDTRVRASDLRSH
jgi:hypothetical protein